MSDTIYDKILRSDYIIYQIDQSTSYAKSFVTSNFTYIYPVDTATLWWITSLFILQYMRYKTAFSQCTKGNQWAMKGNTDPNVYHHVNAIWLTKPLNQKASNSSDSSNACVCCATQCLWRPIFRVRQDAVFCTELVTDHSLLYSQSRVSECIPSAHVGHSQIVCDHKTCRGGIGMNDTKLVNNIQNSPQWWTNTW